MKILFHLGHPAHFHLFKNVIHRLKNNGHNIVIAIKKKDVLENLLIESKLKYINILPEGRKDNLLGLIKGQLTQNIQLYKICKQNRPDILVGTSVACSHISQLLQIPFINVNEDDAKVVPFYSYLSYPFSSIIISPISCNNSQWEYKSIKYNGYHELAYLHPNNFTPDKNIAKRYIDISSPYFIIRFAKLTAHHDKNKKGINTDIALNIISILEKYGNIFINSEVDLISELRPYQININPMHMHHILYYANLFIGDSQTMSAEAAVLGTPSIRFNDFVGKLNYLEELEHDYSLTFGIKTSESLYLYQIIEELIKKPKLGEEWKSRKNRMLVEKIDVTSFISWFIEKYPKSVNILKNNPDYQYNFK